MLRSARRGLTRVLRCSGTAVPEALRRQLQECLQAKGCMLLELHLDGCKGGLADLEGGEGGEGGGGGEGGEGGEEKLPPCLENWQLSQLLSVKHARFLRTLRLDDCGLTGPIPDAMHLLWNLEELSLASNGLSGPLPAGLGQCARMRFLSLRGNRLNGTIPASLARCAPPRAPATRCSPASYPQRPIGRRPTNSCAPT